MSWLLDFEKRFTNLFTQENFEKIDFGEFEEESDYNKLI